MAVFRVEKNRNYTVMSNLHFRNAEMSLKAKGLLSLMLSLPENWDYTLAGLAQINKDGLSSIRAAVAELEEFGYLKRRRLRNEMGQLAETEYTILEEPELPENVAASASEPICDFPILDNPTLEKPILENQTQLNIDTSSNNQINLDLSSTYPSINPDSYGRRARPPTAARMDEIEQYREIIKENIEYGWLLERFARNNLDEIVELLVEAVCSPNDYIRVAGADFPAAVVKSRMLKINASHIEYVFECLRRNTTKINNIKNYLLTALYNAPCTIDSYYQAEVNHDLYGSK